MKIFRFIIFLCALCAFSCSKKTLRVGMEMGYPPFEMRDERGEPAGVSVDLAKALAERLGLPLELENIPFDGLIPALKTGRIQLVISSMTATPERAQTIDFSDPYLNTGLCLLVGAGTDIQNAADVDRPGRKIAVVKATTGHLWAQQLKHAEVRVFPQESVGVLEVAQGRCDAFIYDQMSVLRNWQSHQDTTRALLQPIRTEQWAIGLRKGDDALRAQVNEFLKEFRANGGFEKLSDRWLKEPKEGFSKLGVPFVF